MRNDLSGIVVFLLTSTMVCRLASASPVIRVPLRKPDVGVELKNALYAASKVAKVIQGGYGVGAPKVLELEGSINEENAAVIFRWVDENGLDHSYSYPIRGAVDLVVAATVNGEGPSGMLNYRYVATTQAGSKRALSVLGIVTDVEIGLGNGPSDRWRSRKIKPGEFGFDHQLAGWAWSIDVAVRYKNASFQQTFLLFSQDLPGLVACHAIADWPRDEMNHADSQNTWTGDLPEVVGVALDSIRPGIWKAQGLTLGPVRFPNDPVARLTKVEEYLNEMIKINWIESGGAADQLKNAVKALSKTVASGDGQIVTDQKNKVERLVTSLVERGQALPEVRDFLLVHIAALRSEDTVKK